ncbi:flagellar biosynthesis protein FlgI, partial [Herbaspirillum sp. HC18]
MTRVLLALVLLVLATSAQAAVRIKDIADIKGLRENQIVGYGLVIGLNG